MKYTYHPIDKEMEYVPGERLVVLKYLSHQEPIFTEHFPEFSIYPGSMVMSTVIEALKRFLFHDERDIKKNNDLIFKNIKFKKMSLPGDILKVTVEKEGLEENSKYYRFHVRSYFSNQALCLGKVIYKG